MHFSCRSFIGHPSDTSWSQFWEMEPDDPNLLACRGHLFGLINFSTAEKPVGTQGRQFIDQINEQYYSSTTVGIISQLRETLTHFSQFLNHQSDQLSLVLAVVAGDELHLVVYNSGECILQRGQHISRLLVGKEASVVTISGQSLDTDRFLLCSNGFCQNFSWEDIKSSLSTPNLDGIEENFLSHLYSLDDQSQIAAALVEIHKDSGDHSEPTTEVPLPSPKLTSEVKKPFLSFFHRPHSDFIDHLDSPTVSRRKRINFLLALIILAALFVSIYFGYRRNYSRNLENQYQTLKSQLETKITNAQTVKSLSLSDALTQSQDAQKLLQQMSPYKKNHAEEINQFQQVISGLLSQTGSADSYTPELFFDSSLINNGLPYSRLALSGNNLYLLDTVNGHIDKLDISNKSHQSFATSDDIKNSQFMAEDNGSIYLLKGSQLLLVSGNTVSSKINFQDKITDFTSGEIHFWNGSLYILSLGSSHPSLWKYTPNSTGFTAGENWLKNDQSLPVDSSSLAINGSIWIISKTGVITPYNLGVKKDFTQATNPSLTKVSNLVTSLDSNLLAFTDQGNQVYIYNKSGQSTGKYNYGNRQILGLAYDQTDNFLLVLCDDKKLYKISL